MSDKVKNTVNILIFLCVVALIIININLYTRLNSLEKWVVNQISEVNVQRVNEMNLIRSDFMNRVDTINEKIEQNSKISFNESALIHRYNPSTTSADVEISFYLKEFDIHDEVTVTAKGQSDETFRVTANRSDSEIFSAYMTLPVWENYILNFATGVDIKRTGELMKISFSDKLAGHERFSYHFSHSYGTSGSNALPIVVTFQPNLINYMRGNEALAIKDIYLIFEYNNAIIWSTISSVQ